MANIRPYLKKIWLAEHGGLCSSDVLVLHPTDTENVLTKYLYTVLCDDLFVDYVMEGARGLKMPRGDRDAIMEFLVPVPSLDTQRRIVDEAAALDAKTAAAQADADGCLAASERAFEEMFGGTDWPWATLAEVARGPLEYGLNSAAVPYDGKTRYIRITDIADDGSLGNSPVSAKEPQDYYLLDAGDLLLARSGSVGRSYLHRQNGGRFLFASYLIRVVPNGDLVTPEYLFQCTRTNAWQTFVDESASGTIQKNISAQRYGLFEVPLPPIELQREFSAIVQENERRRIGALRDKAALEAERKGLLERYFG